MQKVGHMHDQDRQQKWVPQYDHNGLWNVQTHKSLLNKEVDSKLITRTFS